MKSFVLKINLFICLLLSQIVSAKSAVVKDSVYFSTRLAGDSVQVFIHKTSRDSSFVYTDTAKSKNQFLILNLISSKHGILNECNNSAFSKACGLQWMVDSADLFFSYNKINFKRNYIFKCLGAGFNLADSGKHLLFTCRLNGFSDTFLSEVTKASVKWIKKNTFEYPVFNTNVKQIFKFNGYIYCDAEKGKSSNLGVHLGGFNSPELNYGVCISSGVVCIVFDANTHQRKAVGSIVPKCPWGAKWTTFGNVEDYQIYYAFDLSNKSDSADFITFLKNIDNCDILAMCSKVELNTRYISKPMDSLMGTFGSGLFKHDTTKVAYALLGRKGISPGMAAEAISKTGYVGVNEMEMNQKGGICKKFEILADTGVKLMYYTVKTAANTIQKITKNHVQLYPNPNNGTGISLHFAVPVDHPEISIYNIDGMMVLSQNINQNQVIDWNFKSELSAGIYFLKIKTEDSIITQKIIVQNN